MGEAKTTDVNVLNILNSSYWFSLFRLINLFFPPVVLSKVISVQAEPII